MGGGEYAPEETWKGLQAESQEPESDYSEAVTYRLNELEKCDCCALVNAEEYPTDVGYSEKQRDRNPQAVFVRTKQIAKGHVIALKLLLQTSIYYHLLVIQARLKK